jgi:hydrogenase expression/formation protein HypE
LKFAEGILTKNDVMLVPALASTGLPEPRCSALSSCGPSEKQISASGRKTERSERHKRPVCAGRAPCGQRMDDWGIESSRGARIIPVMTDGTIELDHGAGGGLSQTLVDELIAPRLGHVYGGRMEAGAVPEPQSAGVVLRSGSFASDPIFFGNGDIGRLAVCGTINNLAVSGALPCYLTLSLVLERGLPVSDLARVLDSVREAAVEADIAVLAGETRVVGGGVVDGLAIETTGVGELTRESDLGMTHVRPGDAIIVTGWLGNHAIHMLSLRQGLGLERRILSDCASLDGFVWNVLEDYAAEVHCMCGITRGGLARTLNELAAGARVEIEIEEHRLPVQRETAKAAAALGVDPLCLANEGNICMIVEGDAATEILELVRWQPQGVAAQIVGTVRERGGSAVTMVCEDGSEALLEPLYGAGGAGL